MSEHDPRIHENSRRLLRTLDHVQITDGLAVWDYNLDRGFVRLDFDREGDYAIGGPKWDGWFEVVAAPGDRLGSLMNGERVWTRHPSTGEKA